MTIFLSAFLLFQVQPLIGKAILPWFGGSAATWMTCLLFFQVLLLGGYLYAHFLVDRLSLRRQGLVHLAILAASLVLLPIAPSQAWKPTDASNPTWRILLLLLVSVGGPFFVLSTTGPLIQAWYARTRPGRSPYRLYSLSNAGSLLALVSYPFVLEPALRLHVQATVWSWAYAAFVLLCGGWSVRMAFGKNVAEVTTSPRSLATAPGESFALDAVTTTLWILLALCGSAMLLATTNQITQNVAPVPFLWILPLSIYLLSFILCFGERGWYRRKLVGWGVAGSLFAVAVVEALEVDLPLAIQVAIHALVLFTCCMACHGELATLKPSPRHLTAYYLSISLGGALGGALVTLVAPAIFDSLLEFPAALVACFVAWSAAKRRDALRERLRRRFAGRPRRIALEAAGLALLVGAAIPCSSFAWRGFLGHRHVIEASRSFYGTLQVREEDAGDPARHRRQLVHGSIAHGIQFESAALRAMPTAYYGRESAIEFGIRVQREAPGQSSRPLRIGVIGMGAGVIAAYAGAGDALTFYEIDPDVAGVARRWFTFVADAEARGARVEVKLGDARLVLERELAQGVPEPYDILVVDAFNGDAIPVHLLSVECFDLYRRRLAADGMLCVHASNLYLELPAVVRVQFQGLGWPAENLVAKADPDHGCLANDWVIASPMEGRIESLRAIATTIRPWPEIAPPRPWTDDYSSLFPLLK